MSPRVERSTPPYLQITDHYRQLIHDGALEDGYKLPPIIELAKEWGVATATVQKALGQLRSGGLIRSTPQGTFVTRARMTTGPDRLQMLRATGNGYRAGERAEVVKAELTNAPKYVAEALNLEQNTDVVQRQRVYTDNDGVVTVSTSWLPGYFAQAAPELLATEPLPKMTFGLIEERTERRAVHRRDVVAIKDAPEDIASLLKVAPGTPVLTMTNYYWDQHGDVTEFAEDYLGGGRYLTAEYHLD
jgi:DNA-binding GntR family transcriptional regulator